MLFKEAVFENGKNPYKCGLWGYSFLCTFALDFKKMIMYRIITLALLAAICLPTSATATLDPTDGVTPVTVDTSRVFDLDEVIVVSQPKETQRLRMQPLSSTVLTGSELQRLNVRDLSQLSDYVPSFNVPSYGSRLTSSIYVRGLGSRTGSPAVGFYYDNVPIIGKTAINRHFYMLDRVDVLRGPQGSLYGMNTEGGMVRLYSKNPMNYQGTDILLGAGTGLLRNVELAHYHRPSDRLAFSVAGFYSGQNGFFTNQNNGERNDQVNEAGARLHLVWTPTGRLTFDLTSDYQYTNQTGFAYGLYDEVENHTSDPSTTFTNNYRRQMVTTGLSISYDFGSLLLNSTTSHQYLWDRMNMDQDYVADDYMRLQQVQKLNALTQELSLRSHSAAHWQHTTGLFASYQWLHTVAPVYFGDAMGTFIMSQWGMPVATHSFMSFEDNHVPGDFHTPQLNLGAYHESRIELVDRLTLTLGLRYDYEQVKIDYLTQAKFNLAVNMGPTSSNYPYLSEFASVNKKSYSQLLPKFGLTWRIDNYNSNLFAVVSKGFRAGGYNLQMFSDIFQTEERGLGHELRSMMSGPYTVEHTQAQVDAVNDIISYEPEESWNVEVGTHLNLFDGRLHADLSAFYTQTRNQQLSVMAGNYGYGRMMVNAGRSRSCGLELALRGSAFDNHLTWGATYSYTHATFTEYDDSISVGTGADLHNEYVSYKDKYVPFVPQHTFSVNGDWRVDLNHDIFRSITYGLNIKGQGKTYWDIENERSQKFYATLGAHISLDMGAAVLDLWGRNLTNTKYNTFLVYSKMTDNSFAQLGNPVQVGFDLRIHL